MNRKVSDTVLAFNDALEKRATFNGFNIIDIYKFTVGTNGFSNQSFHVDKRHLDFKAIPEIENQLYKND